MSSPLRALWQQTIVPAIFRSNSLTGSLHQTKPDRWAPEPALSLADDAPFFILDGRPPPGELTGKSGGPMKITGVEAQYLKIPLAFRYGGGDDPRGQTASEWTGTVVVQIRTDEGTTGLGDIAIKGNQESIGRGTRDYVEEVMVPILVGQDPFNLELLIDRLWAANLHENSVMVAGIDIALHDLVAKALGIPVYRYLGGKYRERVPLTWNVPADRDISVMVAQASNAVESGFRNAIKVKTGTPWTSKL